MPIRETNRSEGRAALLQPVRFDEPFGLAAVEAMARGTPVLAINRGRRPEIPKEGVTGFLAGEPRSGLAPSGW